MLCKDKPIDITCELTVDADMQVKKNLTVDNGTATVHQGRHYQGTGKISKVTISAPTSEAG